MDCLPAMSYTMFGLVALTWKWQTNVKKKLL